VSYPNIDISEILAITSIEGNINRGGWECRFTSKRDSDIVEPFQYLQLIWRGFFGTSDPTGGMLGFQGHVLPLQISFDRVGSLATFVASTTDAMLKNGWLQGISFWDFDTTPRVHYHHFDSVTGGAAFERMTMGRIVRHLLGYYDQLGAPPATNPDWVAHTNLVHHATQNPHGWITLDNVTTEPFDVALNPEGTMRVDRYNVHETENLWEAIRQIAKNEFFIAYFDKLNNFYYMRHPMYASTLPDPVMTFDEGFSVGRPVVYVRHNAAVSDVGSVRQVRLHAVTDDGDTLHSEYPASATHIYGKTDEISYIRCNDQDTLDEWARVHYLFQNRDVTVRWTAPGVCGLLFELMDRVEVTYSGTSANGVHLNWSAKKFWIHGIQVTPGAGFSGTTVFTLEAENV
jgi:hypothetical protein